jgi:hypothetical protein
MTSLTNTLGKRIGNYNVDMKTEQEKTTIIIFAIHSTNVSHSFYNNIVTCKLTHELRNIWKHQI